MPSKDHHPIEVADEATKVIRTTTQSRSLRLGGKWKIKDGAVGVLATDYWANREIKMRKSNTEHLL